MTNEDKLIISAYNPDWVNLFLKERANILSLIPKRIGVHVVEIGSAILPNLLSRPIIDIAIGVENPLDVVSVRDVLWNNGYVYFPKRSSLQHFVMGKLDESKECRFYLHIVEYYGDDYAKMGLLIKALKSSDTLREEYNALKIKAYQTHMDNKSYLQEKKAFWDKAIHSMDSCLSQ